MENGTIFYPATKVINWVNTWVYACDRHAKEIEAVGEVMGYHVQVKDTDSGAECQNCINESKKGKESKT